MLSGIEASLGYFVARFAERTRQPSTMAKAPHRKEALSSRNPALTAISAGKQNGCRAGRSGTHAAAASFQAITA
jgi:hypothetical protein